MRGRTVNANIETRKARARLCPHKVGHFCKAAPGISLGYRKLPEGAGTWVVRWRDGDRYRIENLRGRDGGFVVADDFATADGTKVLDYGQALEAAREAGKAAGRSVGGRELMLTVADAISAYREDLSNRGKRTYNADHIRHHLPEELSALVVAKLNVRDFKAWHSRLVKAKMLPASINRINCVFKAALNLAANKDERIERRPWDQALTTLPNATESRNVILRDEDVIGIVRSAYQHSEEFGLFVELAAQTGARPISQIAALRVGDLKMHRDAPRLIMPRSKKGNGEKKIKTAPVPITLDLALRLAAFVKGKPDHAIMLTMPGGAPWAEGCYSRRFAAAVKRLDPDMPAQGEDDAVTIYALRHTSIVRQLKAGVPTRVVAATHDTSVQMIEVHYSAHIADHTDELTRRAMLDTGQLDTDNVVPLAR
jgi:Phage integrase family